MKLKTKVSLILIFLVIAVCSLFAACKIGGDTWQEILGDAQHQYITYYAGGGAFSNSKAVKDVYYPAGVPTISDFNTTQMEIKRTDWLFKGWYYVECDAEGNPKFASEEDKEAGIPILTDREVTFPLVLQKDEHLCIGAKWTRDYKLKYFLYDSPEIEVGENTFTNGQEIGSAAFGVYDSITVNYSKPPVESKDATLLEYYVKNEQGGYEVLGGGNKVYKPDVYDETDEDPHVAVYCKYISGVWNMVRDFRDVRDMFGSMADGKSFYVTNDIDCSSNPTINLKQSSINCTIEGNNHKISNQKFKTNNNLQSGQTCSVFGQISSSCKIQNIIFENFEAEASVRARAGVNIYLFSHGIEEGATLTNVAFNGATLALTLPDNCTVYNIQQIGDSGEYQTGNWLFGGFTNDDDFTAVTCKNLTLKINNDKVYNKNQEN